MSNPEIGSDAATAQAQTPKRRPWRKIALIVCGVLFGLLVTTYLCLNWIALSLTRSLAADLLVPAHSIESISIEPFAGRVQVTGVQVKQSEGIPGQALLQLESLTATIALGSLLTDTIRIEDLAVTGLTATVTRGSDGRTTIEGLFKPTLFAPRAAATPSSDKGHFGLACDRIVVSGLTLVVSDQTKGRSWDCAIKNLDFDVSDLSLVINNGAVDLSLGAAKVDIAVLGIDQPDPYPLTNLIHLTGVHGTLAKTDLIQGPYRIPQCGIDNLTMTIFTGRGGPKGSVRQVIDQGTAFMRDLADNIRTAYGRRVPNTTEAGRAKDPGIVAIPDLYDSLDNAFQGFPSIQLERFVIASGSIGLEDHAMTGSILTLLNKDVYLDCHNICFGLDSGKVGTLTLTSAWAQPHPFPDAPLALFATIGPITKQVPDLHAKLVQTAYALDTLGELVTANTRRALGAQSIDILIDARVTNQELTLNGTINSDKNIHYPFTIAGPVQSPKLTSGTIISGAINRLSGGLRNITGNTIGLGSEVVSGGWSLTKDLGSGLVSFGRALGGGIRELGEATVTLNAHGISQGLSKTVSGTYGSTRNVVSNSTGSIGGSLRLSLDDFRGKPEQKAWLLAGPERHQADATKAAHEVFSADQTAEQKDGH
ncbi:MAG: hypothetical protein PF961_09330 [Planctomycetota bacterium]|jgi:hypothetical protein|nr:hypothetical protein [Planctomycetota bacterium]